MIQSKNRMVFTLLSSYATVNVAFSALMLPWAVARPYYSQRQHLHKRQYSTPRFFHLNRCRRAESVVPTATPIWTS
jgi:hypothetical protein